MSEGFNYPFTDEQISNQASGADPGHSGGGRDPYLAVTERSVTPGPSHAFP